MMNRQFAARVAALSPGKATGCKCGTCAKCREHQRQNGSSAIAPFSTALEAERGHRWRHDFSRVRAHTLAPSSAPPTNQGSGGDRLDQEGERRDTERNRRDTERDRQQAERDRRNRESPASPTPATKAEGPPFVCGVDATSGMKNAIDRAKGYFAGWDDDEREESCEALHSLWKGDVAWDILEMHGQVTSDALNKAHRPPCATSGAKPACGSSVTVDGGCHFAGSANYVIFGVMCKLCYGLYDRLLANSSWYNDRMSLMLGKVQFSQDGMISLIDLYKKYVPMMTGGSPASNINAAKQWSIAGYQDWPAHSKTPAPDRANCELTCPHKADHNMFISWYPHVNRYRRRLSAGGF